MSEAEVDRVVKMRKQSQHWFISQWHDGNHFRTEPYPSWEKAKNAETDLVRLGYRKES